MLESNLRNQLIEQLLQLYSPEQVNTVMGRLEKMIHLHLQESRITPGRIGPLDERDAVLITYGDQLRQDGEMPLVTLTRFVQDQLIDAISGIHILPFFPYSSDDGFSVVNYREVDPRLGSWEDVHTIAGDFRLMIDAVVNHISSQSQWFQGFLAGDANYQEYFISMDPQADLTNVVRPRDLPLLTPVETPSGTKHVWTTFSTDQIDLNYSNPDVLLEILDLLLFYVQQGTQIIRLDAIAFLWKEAGTPSIHLPQTHTVIRLIRLLLSHLAPDVLIITETNVPHEENMSYLGDGHNEAHLVYQFALPPLVLHSLLVGEANYLSTWADSLLLPSDQVTFFNFLASHDGIGLRPASGLLPDSEIDLLIHTAEERGGQVSYRSIAGGGQLAYELNINFLSALTPKGELSSNPDLVVKRFLTSQAIMLSMIGLPGIYFHSLVGSQNWAAGVEQTGRARSINREKLTLTDLGTELSQTDSIRHQIFYGYLELLKARGRSPAFNPFGKQTVLQVHPTVFTTIRSSPDGRSQAICMHNVSNRPASLEIPSDQLHGSLCDRWINLLTTKDYASNDGTLAVDLESYETLWLSTSNSSRLEKQFPYGEK